MLNIKNRTNLMFAMLVHQQLCNFKTTLKIKLYIIIKAFEIHKIIRACSYASLTDDLAHTIKIYFLNSYLNFN